MGKNKIGIWFDEGTNVLYVSLRKGASVDSEEIEEDVRIEVESSAKITFTLKRCFHLFLYLF